jgi:hypothetical protein
VFRRPLSLTKPERELRHSLTRAFEGLGTKVNRKLTSSGALARVHRDAETRQAKGPIGRGGMPLGEDREQAIRRIFQYDDMQWIADLFSGGEDVFDEEFSAILSDEYTKLFEIGGQAGRRALGVKGTFNLRATGVVESLDARANKLAGNVAEDIFERLKTVIADEFYLQGKGPREVGKILAEEFDWLSRERATTIARTEAATVTEAGQFLTYRASGVGRKRWLTTLDGRERDTHFDAHGQIRAIDEPFDVGGYELMYPLDPDGPAHEIINCRCSHIPIVAEGQLSDADVWDGENEPDEFAQELIRDPDLPAALRPPPPDDIEDLDFAFPEDEKRAFADLNRLQRENPTRYSNKVGPYLIGHYTEIPVDVEQLEKVVGPSRARRALDWWRGGQKAEREYVRDDIGQFSESGGTGGESSESEGGAKPAEEPKPKKPPRISDEDYAAGLTKLEALRAKAEEATGNPDLAGSPTDLILGDPNVGGFVTASDKYYQEQADMMAVDLGPAFFQRYYAENPAEYEKAVDQMASSWAHIGGTGPNQIRFAAQDAFGFPQAPVWDSKLGANVDRGTTVHDAGAVTVFAGAMRHEWSETQAAMEEQGLIVYNEGAGGGDEESEAPSIEDWMDSPHHDEWYSNAYNEQVGEAFNQLDDDEKREIYDGLVASYSGDEESSFVTDMREWSRDNLSDLESVADTRPPTPGDTVALTDEHLSELRAREDDPNQITLGLEETGRLTYGDVLDQHNERYYSLKEELDQVDQQREYMPTAELNERHLAISTEMAQVQKEALPWRQRAEAVSEEQAGPEYIKARDEYIEKWGPAAYATSDAVEDSLRAKFEEDYEFDYEAADESGAFEEWAGEQGGGGESVAEEIEVDLSRPTVTLYRGIKGNTSSYVSGPVESWSASRAQAVGFGHNVMEKEIPRERILVFQGAPSWKAEGFGETEYEFMVLPDLPSWIREGQPSGPQS